jgi:hypothetical protein
MRYRGRNLQCIYLEVRINWVTPYIDMIDADMQIQEDQDYPGKSPDGGLVLGK